ncbi:MAG: ParA family protein [Firmicutes bacterium]|nr:ParA family protein [Bacillota bacterium]
MGKIIAITNQKGGVGKTTSAMNISARMGYLGKKVLLVDFDSQGNASHGLLHFNEIKDTVFSVISEKVAIEDAIVHKMTPPIDILPSDMNLAGAENLMEKYGVGKELFLKKQLDKIKDQYDYILIDCPPSLGLITINALTAADSVLIPVQCEYYALEGITQLLLTIRLVQQTYNRNIRVEGIFLTMFDIRTKLSVDVSQEVRKNFNGEVYQNHIPRNVTLSEAPSRTQSIFEYDPKGNGARAYAGLTDEILKRNEGK